MRGTTCPLNLQPLKAQTRLSLYWAVSSCECERELAFSGRLNINVKKYFDTDVTNFQAFSVTFTEYGQVVTYEAEFDKGQWSVIILVWSFKVSFYHFTFCDKWQVILKTTGWISVKLVWIIMKQSISSELLYSEPADVVLPRCCVWNIHLTFLSGPVGHLDKQK